MLNRVVINQYRLNAYQSINQSINQSPDIILFTAGKEAQIGIERSGKTVKYFRNRRIQFGVLADAFVV